MEHTKDNLSAAHDAIIHSRVNQTIQADRSRRKDPPMKAGDLAYLSTENLNLPKDRAWKLIPLYIGLYEILEAFPNTSNYVLKLPLQLERQGIHPCFHISRLAPYEPNDMALFPGQEVHTFYDFREDPNHEPYIHKILDHAWVKKDLWFKVKWELGDTMWEPQENCKEPTHVDDYLALQNVQEIESLPKKRETQCQGKPSVRGGSG